MLKLLRPRGSCFLPGVVALALSLLAACDSEPRPKDSTETGNPPFLDLKLVTLEGEAEQAFIVGQPGAVSPPTGIVTAVELRTGGLFQAQVNSDGSFEIPVSPPEGLFYVVTGDVINVSEVLLQAGRDPDGIVSLGGVSLDDTLRALNLTCHAQQLAAEGAITTASSEADRSCNEDADCALIALDHACASSCSATAVSGAAAVQFETFQAELTESVCPAYASGECAPKTAGCPQASATIDTRCRFGTCSVETSGLVEECGGPQVALAWVRYPAAGSPESAAAFSYAGLTYGALTWSNPDGTHCFTTLSRCGGESADLDVAMRAAVLHPDVQAAVAQGGLRHEASGATRIQVDVQPTWQITARLDFPLCESCGVPEGFLALARVLAEVEQASCAPLN